MAVMTINHFEFNEFQAQRLASLLETKINECLKVCNYSEAEYYCGMLDSIGFRQAFVDQTREIFRNNHRVIRLPFDVANSDRGRVCKLVREVSQDKNGTMISLIDALNFTRGIEIGVWVQTARQLKLIFPQLASSVL